jgi:hypothetical protein
VSHKWLGCYRWVNGFSSWILLLLAIHLYSNSEVTSPHDIQNPLLSLLVLSSVQAMVRIQHYSLFIIVTVTNVRIRVLENFSLFKYRLIFVKLSHVSLFQI